MTFALGGGGGYTKSKNSKGGYVDFILLISAKCEQGEEAGVKNFADVIYEWSLRMFSSSAD